MGALCSSHGRTCNEEARNKRIVSQETQILGLRMIDSVTGKARLLIKEMIEQKRFKLSSAVGGRINVSTGRQTQLRSTSMNDAIRLVGG